MFQTITQPRSAVDACADALRESILSGELVVGERLPAERKLAESFGVGRVTVRSALGRLAEEGLLSVRQGRGYEVCDFERVSGPQVLPALVHHARAAGDLAELVEELLEVRRELARAVLRRLATTGADIEGVRAAVERFVVLANADAPTEADITRADMEIVHALLDAANNRVLRLSYNPFLGVVDALPELRAIIYADPRSNALGYRALLTWLDAPDAARVDAVVDVLAQRDEANVRALRKEA